MIKIIAGAKGTGKTARLVDDINNVAAEDSNVVCIERGTRLGQLLKHKVRLINIDEYPCTGYDQLLSFIGGVCSKDYDLTHVYMDSVRKVAKSDNLDELAVFLDKLDKFLANSPIVVTIILSVSEDLLPDAVKKYC